MVYQSLIVAVFVLCVTHVAFMCLKMDIMPRKHAKIIALNDLCYFDSEIYCFCSWCWQIKCIKNSDNIQEYGSSSQKRRGKCGSRWKTTLRNDKILKRNSKINLRKTSSDLKRDLLEAGFDVRNSTVRCRLLEVDWKARRPVKNNW